MPAIVPGSAFCPTFKSDIDWSELGRDQVKRQRATKERERQQALGNNGTIYGLSVASDEQIGKSARIRKSSKLG